MIMNNVYELEELVFVAGDFFTIEFTVHDSYSKELVDLTPFEVSCVISALGNPNQIVLEKDGIKTGDSTYRIELLSSETIDLSGKFVYQPIIKLDEDKQHRPAQGILTIMPAIK